MPHQSQNLKNLLLNYLFENVYKVKDYAEFFKKGYTKDDIKKILVTFSHETDKTRFTALEDPKEIAEKKGFSLSSQKNSVVFQNETYGDLWISKNVHTYEQIGKMIYKDEDKAKFEALASLEVIRASHVDPEFLKIFDKLPKLKMLEVTLKDDDNFKWPALTSAHLQELKLDGWSGKYKGIAFPENLISLTLERKLGYFVNTGLPELTKLKKVRTFAHPKTLAQPILNHSEVEEVFLHGVKEAKIKVAKNSRIKKLSVRESNLEECLIESDILEELEIETVKPLTLEIKNPCLKLKKVVISAKKIENKQFLNFILQVEELVLDGLEELDLNVLTAFLKLKKLTLRNIKALSGFEVLEKFKNLQDLVLETIAKIELTRNFTFKIPGLTCTSLSEKNLKIILANLQCEQFKGTFLPKLDLEFIQNLDNLKELKLFATSVKNAEILDQAKQLKILHFQVDNEVPLTFLSSLTQLEDLVLPVYRKQKQFILEFCQNLSNCKIDFYRSFTNGLIIEDVEEYKGFQIKKYQENQRVYFGFSRDLTEEFHRENNHEVEDFLRALAKKQNSKNTLEFDSEAGQFCVYSPKMEELRWLIDLVDQFMAKEKS